ncbi:protein-ADP-ribose hydrolase [Streptomyces griseorubiginosus]|uniref:protein-ADP-ribose hydrolase n=1 Tax=Streptomyces griseorubiginosus TaxID=67304 RepID=UPI00364C9AE2
MTPNALRLDAYRAAIALDTPPRPLAPPAPAEELPTLTRAALRLLAGDPAALRLGLTAKDVEQADDTRARLLLRTVLTVRAPGPLPDGAAEVLDALLSGERLARTVTDPARLPTLAERLPTSSYRADDRTSLWQGDITTLAADAIVNAANSAMLGCFVPLHPCIDNAIHSAAGPGLRDDCHTVMELQGHPEPTGTAKITRGGRLPAPYVLHTVGPIVDGTLGPDHGQALASSYRACLDLAAETGGIRTVAFCSISTGVFGFPKAPAARIALDTVADWLDEHPGVLDRVIFNVYADDDHATYHHALT